MSQSLTSAHNNNSSQSSHQSGKKRKFILAYSGGLDTSIIATWLKEEYDCELITYTANLGHDCDFEAIKAKAIKSGATKAIVEDVKAEFLEKYVWNLIKSGAKYETKYLMGTISRYLIGEKLAKLALAENADAIVHGATGKGNDQVRFEMSISAIAPDVEIIAPWRTWDMKSREDMIDYAKKHDIEITATREKPFSTDENIWYISHEGGVLEDCKNESPEDMYEMTQHPKRASNEDEVVEIDFEQGVPTAVNGKKLTPLEIMETLNKIGLKHGIGCLDIVESRVVGMKSRGVYEFPAGEILFQAHGLLESIVLDRDTLHYKQKMAMDYADLVYDGKWFCCLRQAMEAYINHTQQYVCGKVKVRLYKGNVMPVYIDSKHSLYNASLAGFTMNDDYDQRDAAGFIKISSLPAKTSFSRKV